jgi:hypothetical protein
VKAERRAGIGQNAGENVEYRPVDHKQMTTQASTDGVKVIAAGLLGVNRGMCFHISILHLSK